MGNDFYHLRLFAEGDLAISNLDIAGGPKPGANLAKLFLDLAEGAWSGAVGVGTQIAASAGEIALGHGPNGRAATRILPSQKLGRATRRFGQGRASRSKRRTN